jgi:putative exporter of polyketide antibiotics
MSTLSARRALIDDLIVHHRGRIANTAGDSILAEFASVLDAVSCAVEIQTAIDRVNHPESSFAMRFRIGINVGDVMVKTAISSVTASTLPRDCRTSLTGAESASRGGYETTYGTASISSSRIWANSW